MNSAISTINSQHEDMIHDCQFDYYAKKLATCSSDRQIKIFDSAGHLVNTLSDHNSPVWQVAWAHPKFGVILASCSYDGTVLIHKESSQNVFVIAKKHEFHESSVNSISWASHEFGLILACGSSDGRVSFLEYKYGEWFCPIFTYVLFRK
jgi:protein transport protein SEC13